MNGAINKTPYTTQLFMAATAIAMILNVLPLSTVNATNRERVRPSPVKACALSPVTWVRDDRLPPVIRSAPSFDAPIVGRMAHKHLPGEDRRRGVDISVTAISGDWALIDAVKAHPEYSLTATPEGWIELADIYFVMQTSAGFARPDAKSRQVYATDDWIYRKAILGIRDCRKGWLKLTIKGDPEEQDGLKPNIVTAWFRGFCGIEETTCDGVDYE